MGGQFDRFFQLTFLLSFSTFSQPLNYYANISASASGIQLKQQLSNLITSTHSTNLSYTPGIWNLLEVADRDLEDTTKVLLIYGFNDADGVAKNDRTRLVSLRQTGSSIIGFWNREHTFAQSLGTPALGTTFAGADGHHLRAADGQMNTTRNNRPYTYGKGTSKTVGTNQFYPGDEWKGDVARMMMYMYLRYPTQCFPKNVGDTIVSISSIDQMTDMLIIWNQQDPVSEFEQQRNNTIQEFQGNRNPFIDNPEYATKIWGNAPSDSIPNQLLVMSKTIDEFQIFPNPVKDFLNVKTNVKDWNYTITDFSGKIIIKGKKTNSIQVSSYKKGNYIIYFNTASKIIPKHFIVP
jgi:endonuclease I